MGCATAIQSHNQLSTLCPAGVMRRGGRAQGVAEFHPYLCPGIIPTGTSRLRRGTSSVRTARARRPSAAVRRAEAAPVFDAFRPGTCREVPPAPPVDHGATARPKSHDCVDQATPTSSAAADRRRRFGPVSFSPRQPGARRRRRRPMCSAGAARRAGPPKGDRMSPVSLGRAWTIGRFPRSSLHGSPDGAAGRTRFTDSCSRSQSLWLPQRDRFRRIAHLPASRPSTLPSSSSGSSTRAWLTAGRRSPDGTGSAGQGSRR